MDCSYTFNLVEKKIKELPNDFLYIQASDLIALLHCTYGMSMKLNHLSTSFNLKLVPTNILRISESTPENSRFIIFRG